jgi:sugar-specific transcriptional regulator TrmB/DNA-binding CsgD family transcriptional regulator
MLDSVGIDPREEGLYRALLRAPESTVEELAAATGRSEQDTCATVARLEELGLVSRTADDPPRLVPARPDSAIGALVARQRLELDQVEASARSLVAELELHERHRPDRLLEVVVGREAVGARFRRLLADTTGELLVLDRPPYAADAGSSDEKVRDLLRDGVAVRGIYSPDSLHLAGALDEAYSAADAGEASRVHPQVPMKLAVSDRSTALLPLSMDRLMDSALVVHRCSLVDAVIEMFEQLWDGALPVVGTPDDELDGRLLTLLAAGLKDDTIARQLGISSRTVGRRVAELMDRLGARTRFQAGIYADRRGLLGRGRTPPAERVT